MNIDTSLRYRSVAVSGMVGRPRQEVYEHVREIFGGEKLAKFPDDLNTLPQEFKDGNWYSFFGSLRAQDSEANVPHVSWVGGVWSRGADCLDSDWYSSERVVLLED